RRDAGVLPREKLRGDRGGGAGASDGDLDRVENRERVAVHGIAEQQRALDRGKAVARRVPWKVSVDLRREGPGRAARRDGGLDVKSAIRNRKAEDAGRLDPSLAEHPERVLDRLDALREIEKGGDIAPGEEQRSCRRHPCLKKSLRTVSGATSTGSRPRRKMRASLTPWSRTSRSSIRSIVPSRRPTTGRLFSSWNWRRRTSRVSPMWVKSGSGSR